MALVEYNEMDILRTAANTTATAASAAADQELKAVAYAINSAANASPKGDRRTKFIIWGRPMLPETLTQLATNNYIVSEIAQNNTTVYKIRWE